MSDFSTRLMAARQDAGLSQERLGMLAGIDPMSASARMNQYEKGKHEPGVQITRQIALVLNIPEAYFYASNDELAALLVVFHRLCVSLRAQVVALAALLSGRWPLKGVGLRSVGL